MDKERPYRRLVTYETARASPTKGSRPIGNVTLRREITHRVNHCAGDLPRYPVSHIPPPMGDPLDFLQFEKDPKPKYLSVQSR